MDKVALEIIGLSYSQSQTGAYVLIMGERGTNRRLPIVIGGGEAQSIALGVEGDKPARPLTHDLFLGMADTFNVRIAEVVINRFRDGVFYAMLVCEQNGELAMIDARPSDAIAIAVRCGCGIYAYADVIEEAGIVIDDLDDTEGEPAAESPRHDADGGDPLRQLSLSELEERLQSAVDDEDYGRAAAIRDEINARRRP